MPINLYRAIIWSSLLIVLGEGLILARFNFEPIRGGEVLGENTFAFFDELETNKVMEALKPNSGIIANKNADTRDYNGSSADVVDALIRKNKRIYHTDI